MGALTEGATVLVLARRRCGCARASVQRCRSTGVLGQQELGLEGGFGCPAKYGVYIRGPVGAMFLALAPIFSYGGSGRGPAGVALSDQTRSNVTLLNKNKKRKGPMPSLYQQFSIIHDSMLQYMCVCIYIYKQKDDRE
jgi:hypothetical protein